MPFGTRGRADTGDAPGAFTVRQPGNLGQEVLDQDGNTIAWRTDAWLAQVVCKPKTRGS